MRQVALFGELLPEIAQSLFNFVVQRFLAEPLTDLLIGFGISFAIEVLQMFCGRTTDVDDLLMNTLGALIGYWMFLAAERQTSFCLLRRNKTAEAGVAVSRAFQTLAYEN